MKKLHSAPSKGIFSNIYNITLCTSHTVNLFLIGRYGLVADAIIMIGGLTSELRAGGIYVGSSSSNVNGIEDDEDNEDDDSKANKTINYNEVKKYIKLSRDSLADIYKIIAKL